MAQELDIVVRSKRVQWGGASGEADIVWMRENLSAGTFKMEIRALPGDTGAALVTLNAAAAGSEGISAAWDAGYVHPVTGAVVGATTVRLQINETTMEGLATASPGDDPVEAYYDIHLTLSGVKRLFAFGRFIYHPGVTQ
jgi:hypothetical protein